MLLPNSSSVSNHSAIAVFGAAFVTIFLFALTPITTRVALHQIDSLGLGLMRIVAAAPFAGLLLLARRLPPPIADRTQCKLLAISVLAALLDFRFCSVLARNARQRYMRVLVWR
jgi:hypothetical protein